MHGGTDPPGRIGREAHFPFRLEPGSGFEKAHMALLDEVGHGKAVMAETGCQRDDEAHMKPMIETVQTYVRRRLTESTR